MDLGREFRAEKDWNKDLYNRLKTQRTVCNSLYEHLRKLNSSIKTNTREMYFINTRLHNQSVPSTLPPKFSLSNDTLQKLKHNKALVRGLNPGVVTTASLYCTKPSILFESVNRFELLSIEEHEPDKTYVYDFTAAKVNDVVLSTSRRFKREKAKGT